LTATRRVDTMCAVGALVRRFGGRTASVEGTLISSAIFGFPLILNTIGGVIR